MASTTALPPPTSIEHVKRPANFICWLCYFKACAGQRHRLAVLLQGLCRPDRLPAVYCKACAGRIVCWCFCFKACAGHFICRLCLPATALLCHALPAHLCHSMPTAHVHQPRSVLHPPPLFIAMCARITAQIAGTALMAAATRACTGGPCIVHCLCCLSQQGDCVCTARAPLCSLRSF